MSDFGFDDELPGGFQDADIEMAQLEAAAARDARLLKAGRCPHTWIQGPPGPPSAPRRDYLCHHCGATFATREELEQSSRQARGE